MPIDVCLIPLNESRQICKGTNAKESSVIQRFVGIESYLRGVLLKLIKETFASLLLSVP